jgi:hypothetical protein
MRSIYMAAALLLAMLIAMYLPHLFGGEGTNAINPVLINSSFLSPSLPSSSAAGLNGLNVPLALQFVGGLNKSLTGLRNLRTELGNLNETLALIRSYYSNALSMETINYSEARLWASRGLDLVPTAYGTWLNASRELAKYDPSLSNVINAINESLSQQLSAVNQTLMEILRNKPASIAPYSPSLLQVNAPRLVKWGDPIVINGSLSGPPHRPLTIIIGNTTMGIATGANGSFSSVISTDSLAPGNYSLLLYAPPYMGNAPTSAEVNVTVVGEPVHLAISAGTAVAGSTLSIRGTITPWIPGNSTLLVSIDGINETMIINSPTIDAAIPIPVTVGTGRHVLTVTLLPRLPMASASSSVVITILNPLQLSLPPIITAGVAALALLGSRRRPATGGGGAGASEVEARILSATMGRTLGEGARQVVHALAEAIYAVGNEVGHKLMPNQTLREYFAQVGPKMDPDRRDALWRLITLTEPVLYFTHEPREEELIEARELLRRVIHS